MTSLRSGYDDSDMEPAIKKEVFSKGLHSLNVWVRKVCYF